MKIRTFFVEDNATIRKNLVETLLELSDIDPLGHAETEHEGIQWLINHDNSWDLAIVDLFLRHGSGLGVLEACRNRQSHQKIIVLSNYATPDVRQRCLELKADAVFDKSHDIDSLLEFCMNLSPHIGNSNK